AVLRGAVRAGDIRGGAGLRSRGRTGAARGCAVKRETQNILLILLGGALVKIAVNGDYLRYVKPSQQPWIIAGGAVMVLLGGVAIARDFLSVRAKVAAGAEPDEHSHG